MDFDAFLPPKEPPAAAPAAPVLLPPTVALTQGFVFAEPKADADADAPLPAVAAARSGGEAVRAADLQTRQGLRIADTRLMVGYADGRELTDLPALCTLPNAPAWFAGMANLHGTLIPVFDLARWQGADRAPERPMLLVLAHEGDAAGIVIDGLPQRLRFDATTTAAGEAAEGCAPPALQPFVRATHLIDDAIWFDVDCPALFSCLEQHLSAAH